MNYDLANLFNDDSRQKFEHTIVEIKEGDDKGVLLYVGGCDRNTFVFFNQNSQKIIYRKGELESGKVSLSTFLPESRWYQIKNNAVFVFRKPQRQWKRSLCGGTHGTSSFVMIGLQEVTAGFLSTTNENLEEWGLIKDNKEEFKSFGQAVHALCSKSKTRGVALSECFALSPQGVIFNHLDRVGQVNFSDKEYTIDPCFREEFNPLVNNGFKEIVK